MNFKFDITGFDLISVALDFIKMIEVSLSSQALYCK